MIYKRYFIRAIEFEKGLSEEDVKELHSDLIFYVFAPNAVIAEDTALDFLAELMRQNKDFAYRLVLCREAFTFGGVNK